MLSESVNNVAHAVIILGLDRLYQSKLGKESGPFLEILETTTNNNIENRKRRIIAHFTQFCC